MRIKVDIDLCQGHSVCLEECPEVFNVVNEGGEYPKVVVLIEYPDDALREKVVMAEKFCPNKVIKIEE